MKLFMQLYVNVMLYLCGPMFLSSAVLWFVYLRYLVYLGILAMFFFRCYWLYPCVWLWLVVGVWCWFFLSLVCCVGRNVAAVPAWMSGAFLCPVGFFSLLYCRVCCMCLVASWIGVVLIIW